MRINRSRRIIMMLRRFWSDFPAVEMASNVFIFPGQGSQYVGMTKKLSEPPAANSLAFRTAKTVLGYDLLSVCLSGPKSRLDETVMCQPAVMATSLAAAETATRGKPVSECCVATAGFSVGEITALTFAEALSTEAGLQLIHERAAAMQEACQLHRGTMLTVIGLDEDKLSQMCHEARTTEGGVACIANYIFPRGYVISGDTTTVQFVGAQAQRSGATIKEVSVSGAFHSPLMNLAVQRISSVLDTLQINPPKIPVYSNVTGNVYSSTSEIRECLALQVTRPVQWETIVRNIARDCGDSVRFCEVGPGKQLKAMLRRINKEDYKHCINIEA